MLMMDRESKSAALVKAALKIIDGEYATLSGVEELAERLSVSKNHLIRQFTARAGISPGRYLKARRLFVASALLRGRDYSVETVAAMSGFSCGNYFSKVFLREFGASPTQYRLQNAGEPGELEEKLIRELEYIHQA